MVAALLGFVALLTAFVAERFIKASRKDEGHEDLVLAKLDSIEARLERLEDRT